MRAAKPIVLFLGDDLAELITLASALRFVAPNLAACSVLSSNMHGISFVPEMVVIIYDDTLNLESSLESLKNKCPMARIWIVKDTPRFLDRSRLRVEKVLPTIPTKMGLAIMIKNSFLAKK